MRESCDERSGLSSYIKKNMQLLLHVQIIPFIVTIFNLLDLFFIYNGNTDENENND